MSETERTDGTGHDTGDGATGEQEHYFTAEPTVAFRREAVAARVWGHELRMDSGSGVFAVGRVDVGTAALFHETDPPEPGRRILDLGCGYGVIGLAAAASGCTVTAVDVNERAVLLANDNAAALRLTERFTAVTPDGVPDDERFDEIWSNPPIRIGKAGLHDLLLEWLPRLAETASDGGASRAVLVVGKNLGADSLQRWLIEQGWPTERIGNHKRFRVLEVTRAPA